MALNPIYNCSIVLQYAGGGGWGEGEGERGEPNEMVPVAVLNKKPGGTSLPYTSSGMA